MLVRWPEGCFFEPSLGFLFAAVSVCNLYRSFRVRLTGFVTIAFFSPFSPAPGA
jgi:hypothetical protein